MLVGALAEGEIHVPRLGRIPAGPGFRLIAAMNPFDAVGTARVSQAIADRMCRIAIGYQDAPGERRIVTTVAGVDGALHRAPPSSSPASRASTRRSGWDRVGARRDRPRPPGDAASPQLRGRAGARARRRDLRRRGRRRALRAAAAGGGLRAHARGDRARADRAAQASTPAEGTRGRREKPGAGRRRAAGPAAERRRGARRGPGARPAHDQPRRSSNAATRDLEQVSPAGRQARRGRVRRAAAAATRTPPSRCSPTSPRRPTRSCARRPAGSRRGCSSRPGGSAQGSTRGYRRLTPSRRGGEGDLDLDLTFEVAEGGRVTPTISSSRQLERARSARCAC